MVDIDAIRALTTLPAATIPAPGADLRERVARVLCAADHTWTHADQKDAHTCSRCFSDADAALAVVQPELDRLYAALLTAQAGTRQGEHALAIIRAEEAEARAADYEGRYETSHASRMYAESAYRRATARAIQAEAQVRAEAWDEGYYDATNGKWGPPEPGENPYRADEETGS